MGLDSKVVNFFEKKMKALAEKNGLELKKCSPYHFHLRGVFLLNVYPTTGSVYVQGSNNKTQFDTLDFLIKLANGEVDLEGVVRGKRPNNSSRNKRKGLWAKGVKSCFVCGKDFTDFEETTLEHKVPLFKGGSNREDNLSLSHEKCNQDRGNSLSVTKGSK
jgi:hypothetical protein